jgi:L-threonylcarbamoyladenylate synthase
MTGHVTTTARSIAFHDGAAIDRAIPAAVAHLRGGGLLAYPTETVYGLGGGIDQRSVDALIALKGRDATKNFLLLIDDVARVHALGLGVPSSARALADRFWPGPLTLVLPGGERLPAALRGASGGVAVRWTNHAAMARLIAAYDHPMTSTSANAPGAAPATSAGDVQRDWRDALADGTLILLDGGDLPPSAPSTIVDCTMDPPRVILAGAVPVASLRDIVPLLSEPTHP